MRLTQVRKILAMLSRGTFSNWGLNEREVGNSTENWPYLRNNEIWPRLLLITNRKWHSHCQLRRKSLTLDNPEGRYGNSNCSASYLATAGFSCFATALFQLWTMQRPVIRCIRLHPENTGSLRGHMYVFNNCLHT